VAVRRTTKDDEDGEQGRWTRERKKGKQAIEERTRGKAIKKKTRRT